MCSETQARRRAERVRFLSPSSAIECETMAVRNGVPPHCDDQDDTVAHRSRTLRHVLERRRTSGRLHWPEVRVDGSDAVGAGEH